VIKKFKHKGLKQLFTKGKTRYLGAEFIEGCVEILSALEIAEDPTEMNLPGFDFHELKGDRKGTYSVHVNGNMCITFSWDEGATNVNFEDYHKK
jgi:toxin HigB-1